MRIEPPDMGGAFSGASKLSPQVLQTIIAEALGEGPEGMRLVAETIMNRARERGITPEQVVMEKGQYAPHSPQYKAGSAIDLDDPDNIAAATAAWGAAQSTEDPTMGAEYFNVTGTKAPTAGERLQPVWEHGKHTFWNDTSGVKVMQQNLKAAGLYDGEIDGDFGPATKAAANAFRAQLGTDDPMQALTSLGVEPAAGQEAITNILQQPESLPAFQAPADQDLLRQSYQAENPLETLGTGGPPAAVSPYSDEQLLRQSYQAENPLETLGTGTAAAAVLAPVPPPASGAGVDAANAPVPYAGDYNDILNNGAPAAQQPVPDDRYMSPFGKYYDAFETERAGMRTAQAAPPQPGQSDRSDLTQAGPRYDPLNPRSAATPPPMADDPYADFETTRGNVQSPQTLRDMVGQAGLDDSQWDAGALGIPSQAIPPSNLPPLMQQQYEQAARRDWARPQAPEAAPPQYDTRREAIMQQQSPSYAPYNAEAEAAAAAGVRERLANANPARLLRDEREMASIARTQPIGPPESRNYRIGQGLRPDAEALQTAAIGGPDAPPPMATGSVSPSPQATADIGLTAMPPDMSSDAIFAPSELTPQNITDIEQQRANPPAGGIRGWTYDQNGQIVAVGAPTAPAPAPAPAAVAPEAPAASTGTHGAPTGAGSFKTVGNFKAGVDPQLMQAAEQAAVKMGLTVEAFSGKNARSTGTTQHPRGEAIDIRIMDPATGGPLGGDAQPDMKPELFEAYEKYAQGVYHEANVMDPSGKLADKMRWGGYFVQGTPMDLMHLDVNMARGGPPRAGNFKTGLKPEYAKAWGVDPALAQRGVTDPERVAEVLMAPPSATEQTMLTQVDNSGQLLKMAQAADDAGANNIEAVGGTVRVWKDAARTVSGDWEQMEAIAAAGGPGVSIDYAQGVLSVAPVGPQATTSATTATEPTQPPAAVEAAPAPAAPMSTMQDVARAASAAGVHHISVDPVTNVMTGYNNNRQPWTAEQQAQIAAAVPGITVDSGGLHITPAPTTGLTDYDPNATTGTTSAVEAKPGSVVQAPDAAVPISPEAAATPDAPPNMSGRPNAIQIDLGSQPPEGAAGLPNTGPTAAPASLEAVGNTLSPLPPNMVGGPEGAVGLPNTGPTAAPASLQGIADAFNQPTQLTASGLPETQPGAISAVPPPAAITGTEVSEGPGTAAAPTDGRVQLTAPAGPQYNVMPGVDPNPPPSVENLGVLDAGPPTGPQPPVMTGKEKDDYFGPTERVVTTVPIAPGAPAVPENVPGGLYSFAPTETPVVPGPPLPENPYVTPSVATPASVVPPVAPPPADVAPPPAQQAPPEKKTFQEKTEAASGRSKTFSDPIEYAARNSVTDDGKFDHDKFWDQLGDVDLTQTQQTIAAKTAAQGHFTQNKMPNFLSGIGMPDMGGMKNMLGNIGDVAGAIPNPVQGLSNFFGNIFGGGGFDPRSSGIGSDYASSQSGYGGVGNYAGGSLSGGGYGSQSYGGSYSGPGSYNGGGGSQYGSGFGAGGYGGSGTYGGAGGSNIASGIGGAFRNR